MKNYLLFPGKDYLVIKLIGRCDISNCRGFLEEVKTYFSKDGVHLIVNCEHLEVLSMEWIKLLITIKALVQEKDKSLRFILLTFPMKQYLKSNSLENEFKSCASLRIALLEMGLLKHSSLDINFINYFISATIDVLKVQVGIEAQPKKPSIKKATDKLFGDISGVIGIISDSFKGSVVISFPELTFLKMMSTMLGEECTSFAREYMDGAGELLSMIFSQAKIGLNELGYGVVSDIPSVISGREHSRQSIARGIVIGLPFETSLGDFVVEICLAE